MTFHEASADSAVEHDEAQTADGAIQARRFKVFTDRQLDSIPQLQRLSAQQRFEIKVVSRVLPFRVNEYVLEELIDWQQVPDDPIFRLVFPQRQMLTPKQAIASLLRRDAPASNGAGDPRYPPAAQRISGQMELNVPHRTASRCGHTAQVPRNRALLPQPEQVYTLLPSVSWAQFVGGTELRLPQQPGSCTYRRIRGPLLVTSGDPMVMSAPPRGYGRLTGPSWRMCNIASVPGRLSPGSSPIRTRRGAGPLRDWSSRQRRLLCHFAMARKKPVCRGHPPHRATGAQIHRRPTARINDDADVWARMWTTDAAGMVPYYMFVERDTGAQHCFEVPLVRPADLPQAMQPSPVADRAGRPCRPIRARSRSGRHRGQRRRYSCCASSGPHPDWVQRRSSPATTTPPPGCRPEAARARHFFFEEVCRNPRRTGNGRRQRQRRVAAAELAEA